MYEYNDQFCTHPRRFVQIYQQQEVPGWVEDIKELVTTLPPELYSAVLLERVNQPEFIRYMQRCAYSQKQKILVGWPDTGIRVIKFNPDGQSFAVGTEDGEIYFYDTLYFELLHTVDVSDNVVDIAYNTNGDELAVACKGGILHLINTIDRSVKSSTYDNREFNDMAYCPAPDKRSLLAMGLRDGWLIIDADSLQIIKSQFLRNDFYHQEVCFSQDGDLLFVLSGSRVIHVYDVKTWSEKQISDVYYSIGPLSENAIGVAFATGNMGRDIDGDIIIWDGNNLDKMAILSGNIESGISVLEFSKDGKLLISAGSYYRSGGEIQIWDTRGPLLKSVLMVDWDPTIAVHPRGGILAVGDRGGQRIAIWNIYNEEKLLRDMRRNPLFFWIIMNAYVPGRRIDPRQISEMISSKVPGLSFTEMFRELSDETKELVRNCF